MQEERFPEDEWLAKLALEYNGTLPYQSETEVIQWLQERSSKVSDNEENRRFKVLIDEAIEFGGSDDGGGYNTDLMRFARLLQLLQVRAANISEQKKDDRE